VGDKIKKNEMDRAYGTYGEEENCIQGFVRKTKGKTPLGTPKT
jgi:hypothetical protein